jgi:endonuclease-3
LAATEVGDAVHRLLELVNLQEPLPPEGLTGLVRGWYSKVSEEELERIAGFVQSYCDSELARRVATLPSARPERPFAFEHDGVLLRGRLDTLQLDGEQAIVIDYKTNSLAEGTPEEIVEHDYHLQRLVYALACFRGGAQRSDRRDQRRRVPPDAERVHLRRLPGARRRLRRSGAPRSKLRRTRTRYGLSMPKSFVKEARRRVGPKRARIREIIDRLAAAHPDATIALKSRSPLELLVAVMLSAQTTDVNVNRVTEKLFVKYRKPEDYLAVPPEELERDIFATGFYRQKAKAIRGTMAMLLTEFDGEVPRTLDELVRLPGVARKTANVVAAELGEPQGIVVDTHVRRLSQRLGLTKQEDPVKIERDLIKIVPREDWGRFPHLLIWHGRRVCLARLPRCEECVLNDLCPSSRV